ncbi:MAG: hypothetical protein AAF548_19345 [Actinomycetota bacterium]
MRRAVVAVVVALLAAACGGGDGESDAVDVGDPTTTTTAAPRSTTTAPPVETTAEPPSDPTAALADIATGSVALIVDAGATVIDPDGAAVPWDPPGCLSPQAIVSGEQLLLLCPDGALTTVSLIGAGGSSVGWQGELDVLVSAGNDFFIACPAPADDPVGECGVFETGSVSGVALPSALGAPAPADRTAALGDLIVVARGEERWLLQVTGPVAKTVRSGPADDTWGDLVRLGDGTVALAVEVDTGGDSRPEEVFYAEPVTGERLDVDDGADENSLFGVGPDVIRVTPDLNVQMANVRGFRPDGTELWAIDDRTVRATGDRGRVWIYTTGSPTIAEIDPATGETIDELTLPGDVLRDFEAVRADGDWLVARIRGELGDAVVVVRV